LKLTLLVVGLALVSAIVVARDLSSVARKERARRQAVDASGVRTFTNEDLDAYPERERSGPPSTRTRATDPPRDLAKEEAYWRRETVRHQRELARLDAGIRRLEWRLRDRERKWQSKGRLQEDPAVAMIEESLESLREQREAMVMEFRERARKAGAFPGWLR